MLLSDLQARARTLTQTDSSSYADTPLNASLNIHYARIQQIMDSLNQGWYETVTGTSNPQNLVALTRRYAIPSDSMRLIKVQAKLDGVNWGDIYEMKKGTLTCSIETETDITNNFDNNKPFFILEGNNILILSGAISTVSSGLRFHYVQRQANLASATGDSPAFPTEYHQILAQGAAMDYFYSRQSLDRGDRWSQKFEEAIAEMTIELTRRSTTLEISLGANSARENYD